jgi:hypothetical protein
VLHVPSLSTNILSIYHITHFFSRRKVEFTPDPIVITDISTGSQLAHGIANHGSRLYFFSHFVPKSISTVFMSQSNDINRLLHEIFGHINYRYFHQLSKENMVEGLPSIKFTSSVCQGCILGNHPEKKFDKGKAQRDYSPHGMIHSDITIPFPQPSINIQLQHIVPYTPQQNGVAERKNRSLKEMANCMLQSKSLAPKIWDEYIHCASYIQN